MHATRIQRFLRGYLITSKLMLKVRRERLHLNKLYFDKMKRKLWTDTTILIQYHVRKWLVRTADSRAKKKLSKRPRKKKVRKETQKEKQNAIRVAMGM